MSYQSTYALSREEQIIQRLSVAAADVARDVFVEDAGTPQHDVRIAMVPYVGPRTQDFLRFAREVALILLLLNPALAVESTDEDYKTALASLWTVYAQILEAKGLIEVAA